VLRKADVLRNVVDARAWLDTVLVPLVRVVPTPALSRRGLDVQEGWKPAANGDSAMTCNTANASKGCASRTLLVSDLAAPGNTNQPSMLKSHNILTRHKEGSVTLTTVTARDFARDLASAKRAANAGPVIVTDRGRPAYALLKIEDDYKLDGIQRQSLLAVMDAIPGGDVVFEPSSLAGNDFKPADLD